MRTWLILASLFGVVFTSVVKRPKLAKDECGVDGKVLKAGEEIPVPGMCAVYVCEAVESNYYLLIKNCDNVPVNSHKDDPESDPKSLVYPGCCRNRRTPLKWPK
ncbi:hypothetical protein GE061_019447 [Apolygus lucorum]|uniref:Single domain-containing protein n=1 Tax=Apolygus lucorum TaxID=248454 RepID=A0A8S9XAF0_APOLU|nr:hypothetical protein GE061_019447 [Apolygus lucorum]